MGKQKSRTSFSGFFKLVKDAFVELAKNDPLRMAGATAFFTIFALPPILVMLIQGIGFFFSTQQARSQVVSQLSTFISKASVAQLLNTLKAFDDLAQNKFILIFGFLFLLFVATTLFGVIKNSVNQMWKIKVVHRSKIGETLMDRFKAIAIIVVAGVLFVLALLAEGFQGFIGRNIFKSSPHLFKYFNVVLSHLLTVLIVTAWFAVVFRYLPDARPKWRVVVSGALLTGMLFAIGKVLVRWLLSYSNINTLYGTSASVVLLMLFVFYASLILYFGAAFTKVYGVSKNMPIKPSRYASHYQLVTDEADNASNEA